MILLVRDEDVPAVAAAITAFATEEGLDTLDVESEAQNPIAMLGILTGPRVMVSAGEDQVVVFGLESLDVAEADEWGTAISAACETEVVAIEAADDGVLAYVFDGGELDETIEVPLDPSGRTRAPLLADLAPNEDGQRELEEGVSASSAADLLQAVLRCLGATSYGEDATMLAFLDPLDADDEDLEDGEAEPRLDVAALPGAALHGRVGAPATSVSGNLFAVSVRGTEPVEGVRLELSGDALSLLSLEQIEVWLRVRGSREIERRVIERPAGPEPTTEATLSVDLADAFLEPVDARPPSIDPTDLFATMQRLVSAGDAQALNTLLVGVTARGARAGEGTLALSASAPAASLESPESPAVPVRIAR